jgi:hypothetical protein
VVRRVSTKVSERSRTKVGLEKYGFAMGWAVGNNLTHIKNGRTLKERLGFGLNLNV